MNAVVGKIVGVDVGGTFTDLFYYDEDAARFRTAKVPSNRGDEAIGFLEGLEDLRAARAARLDRARHDGRHQCAARAQRRAHRPHHDARASATCSRCAVATAATPGVSGATSCRSSTATCASRSASAPWRTATIREEIDPEEVQGRCQDAARHAAPRRSPSCSSTPMPIPRTSSRRSPPRERSGRTRTYRLLGPDPARDPRVRAHLDDGAQCLSPAGGRELSRQARSGAGAGEVSPAASTSCSRTAASCRPPPRGACRCARRCPAPPQA